MLTTETTPGERAMASFFSLPQPRSRPFLATGTSLTIGSPLLAITTSSPSSACLTNRQSRLFASSMFTFTTPSKSGLALRSHISQVDLIAVCTEKTRPCFVVSLDELHAHLRTVIHRELRNALSRLFVYDRPGDGPKAPVRDESWDVFFMPGVVESATAPPRRPLRSPP